MLHFLKQATRGPIPGFFDSTFPILSSERAVKANLACHTCRLCRIACAEFHTALYELHSTPISGDPAWSRSSRVIFVTFGDTVLAPLCGGGKVVP